MHLLVIYITVLFSLHVFHVIQCHCFLLSGTFKLTIEFTEEYPNKPPTVRFVSKMFHPNGMYWGSLISMTKRYSLCFVCYVSKRLYVFCPFAVYADGSICLDILQNRWSPTYDVSSILTSIQVI